MKKVLNTVGGFALGTGISVTFILTMDDVIYRQMRRNVIVPISGLYNKDRSELELNDIKSVGSSSMNFIS